MRADLPLFQQDSKILNIGRLCAIPIFRDLSRGEPFEIAEMLHDRQLMVEVAANRSYCIAIRSLSLERGRNKPFVNRTSEPTKSNHEANKD